MLKKIYIVALVCAVIAASNFQTSAKSGVARYPYLLNEKFVVAALRTISGAQATYAATEGNGSYGTLSDLARATLVDSVLATGTKYGYAIVVVKTDQTPNSAAVFSVTATPLRYRRTGRKSFYINQTGVMRGADKNGTPATAADPVFEGECVANEPCAIANLRTLHGAEVTYQAISGDSNFGVLSQLYAVGLIGEPLARGYVNGYNYTVITVTRTDSLPASFAISATPINYGVTGIRSFYIAESGVIRAADRHGEPATGDDPPIEN